MAFNPEEEVPPENIEMIGRPVQESSCVETRPWPSSDKQSHNHPGPADTMGINSKPKGQIKVTDRIAGQKKVFWKRQKAKPKMQTAEAAGTEGGPQNTRAPFRLQEFMCFKISKRYTILLLLVLLAFPVNSNETPKQRMCAVCLEKDCATGVRRIYPAGSNIAIWPKANSQTAIQNCCMENLKADAPCKMANGSLIQPADNPLHFDGIDTYDVRCKFNSQISPCADLNLPPSSTPSPGVPHLAPVTKTPNHNTSTPAAPNITVMDIVIGIFSIMCIIFFGFVISKLYNWRRGHDRGYRKGNNGVPPHDAVHPDENTMEKQPLDAEVPNGNVNGVH